MNEYKEILRLRDLKHKLQRDLDTGQWIKEVLSRLSNPKVDNFHLEDLEMQLILKFQMLLKDLHRIDADLEALKQDYLEGVKQGNKNPEITEIKVSRRTTKKYFVDKFLSDERVDIKDLYGCLNISVSKLSPDLKKVYSEYLKETSTNTTYSWKD